MRFIDITERCRDGIISAFLNGCYFSWLFGVESIQRDKENRSIHTGFPVWMASGFWVADGDGCRSRNSGLRKTTVYCRDFSELDPGMAMEMTTNHLEMTIDPTDMRIEFIRSSGPGGQNVNKVATAAQLRFDAIHSKSITPEVRERLIRLAGKRVNAAGEIIIDARRYRTQQRNREDAIERLITLIERASVPPEIRRKSPPPTKAKLQRLGEKKHRAVIKRLRCRADVDD